jgi:transcriptional regulator with XRE-family HTH domain
MPRPVQDSLAARLKLARTRRGLTQTQLAEASGLNQSDISKLELGDSLRTSAIAKLARALGVRAAWLEDGGDEPDWSAPVVEDGAGLPADELALLRAYRALTDTGRAMAIQALSFSDRARRLAALHDDSGEPLRNAIYAHAVMMSGLAGKPVSEAPGEPQAASMPAQPRHQ